ncbi:MAG: OmpA family protein [Thermogutta sp.]|nr:OmpA family protein [Thermogutta sp.]
MRFCAAILIPAALFAAGLSGCAQNRFATSQNAAAQQQQAALSRQLEEAQARAVALDRDNQQLQTMLAQANQRAKILEDQMSVVQRQLTDTTAQVAQLQKEKEEAERQVKTLNASLQRSGSVSIQPNNSLSQALPAVNIPGVQVRRDGDVIRVELPADQLFEPGILQFRPDAIPLLTAVGAEIARTYPNQMIGVEGFTDSGPLRSNTWKNHLQMSVSWAAAVQDALVSQGIFPADQLFVVGHGASHPIMSNATEAGRLRNRRVELVVYPEKRSSPG